MTRLTENTRAKLMFLHGLAMITLGLALFYVRATKTNLLFYVFGGAFAVMLVVASPALYRSRGFALFGRGLRFAFGHWIDTGCQSLRASK